MNATTHIHRLAGLLLLTLVFAASYAQISQYAHSPVIVGQQDLRIKQGQTLMMHPDSLIIGDLDQGDYSGYQMNLSSGTNYIIKGNEIVPKSGYTGMLYVPCQVDDGQLVSNTYLLELLIAPAGNDRSSIASQRIYVSPDGNDQSAGSFAAPFGSLEI